MGTIALALAALVSLPSALSASPVVAFAGSCACAGLLREEGGQPPVAALCRWSMLGPSSAPFLLFSGKSQEAAVAAAVPAVVSEGVGDLAVCATGVCFRLGFLFFISPFFFLLDFLSRCLPPIRSLSASMPSLGGGIGSGGDGEARSPA
ncbi:unnamed protein product, partial [Ectocarpus sp. 12 AP-2014]